MISMQLTFTLADDGLVEIGTKATIPVDSDGHPEAKEYAVFGTFEAEIAKLLHSSHPGINLPGIRLELGQEIHYHILRGESKEALK